MLRQNHKKKLDFIGEKELVNDLPRGEMCLCLGKLILRMILEIVLLILMLLVTVYNNTLGKLKKSLFDS